MSSSITFINNCLTMHKNSLVSAIGLSSINARISAISTDSRRLTTINDISTWSAGDYVAFTPSGINQTIEVHQILSINLNSYGFTLLSPLSTYTNENIASIPPEIPHIINLTRNITLKGDTIDTRGSIRLIDNSNLILNNVSFANFGLRDNNFKSSIALINSKGSNIHIKGCVLLDNNTNANFIKNFTSNTNINVSSLTGNNLSYTDNQLLNLGLYSLVLTGLTFDTLHTQSNTFLRAPVLFNINKSSTTQHPSTAFLCTDNLFLNNTSTNATVYIDFKNIATESTNYDILYNNVFFNNNTLGLYTTNLSTSNLYNKFINTNSVSGSLVIDNSKNIDIINSQFINNKLGSGVYAINVSSINISGCLISNNTQNGLYISSRNIPSESISIINTTFSSNSSDHVWCSSNSNLSFYNNTANNSNQGGVRVNIDLPIYSNNYHLTGNYFADNKAAGIAILNNINQKLTSLPVKINENTFNNNNCGITGQNIIGTITSNYFNFNKQDINVSTGNGITLFVNNTSNITLSSNYNFINFQECLNYNLNLISDNLIYNSNISLTSGKYGVYKYEQYYALDTIPVNGIQLRRRYSSVNPSNLSTDKESIVYYVSDIKIKYLKITFNGSAASDTCRLLVYINDINAGVVSTSPAIITVPTNKNIDAKYTKISIVYEQLNNLSPNTDSVVNITNIQYSYNRGSFFNITQDKIFYNYKPDYINISPSKLIQKYGIILPIYYYISLKNTNFKDFKVLNTLNDSYLNLTLKTIPTKVYGSYYLNGEAVNTSVDAYQSQVDKSLGIVSTALSGTITKYKHGSITTSNEEVYDARNSSTSECLFPNTSVFNKLKSGRKYITVRKNNSASVYVYVKKSAFYNGSNPRLIVGKNTTLGIPENTIIATHTNAPGEWQLLKGTIPATSFDGVVECFIDCDGTTGFIAIDSWAAPSNPTVIAVTPSVTPTNTPTISKTPRTTPTTSRTPTPTPTITVTNTLTPTITNTVSQTITITPTTSPQLTPSNTSTPDPTITPTRTVTRTPTNTPTYTPTISVTPTITPTISVTPTYTRTPTVTKTSTRTPTPTPSVTKTCTPTCTQTRTPTPTYTVTPTYTPTYTVTPTYTPTITLTPSITPSITPTISPSKSFAQPYLSIDRFWYEGAAASFVSNINTTIIADQSVWNNGSSSGFIKVYREKS